MTLQVESAMAMRSMQPQIKAIQQRYASDQVTLRSLFLQIGLFFLFILGPVSLVTRRCTSGKKLNLDKIL